MATAIELVLDCNDPDSMVGFWAAALGYELRGTSGNYRALRDPDGVGPALILQGVDEPKTVKNRFHVDIHADDIEAEATRLIGLGARRLRDEPLVEHGTAWILMSDPEGNELCVCQG